MFSSGAQQFALKSPVTLQREGDGAVAEFVLPSGQEAVFVLRHSERPVDHSINEPPADGNQLLSETTRFWRSWVAQSQYHGRWRETVTRSALALKLLTYLPSGAIVAAPTTSLPEEIGGVRLAILL